MLVSFISWCSLVDSVSRNIANFNGNSFIILSYISCMYFLSEGGVRSMLFSTIFITWLSFSKACFLTSSIVFTIDISTIVPLLFSSMNIMSGLVHG